MNATQILDELEARQIQAKIEGQGLELVGPRGALPPELADEIRRHKPELVEIISLLGWPEVSREYVRQFRVPQARLYPFLGKSVSTPHGPARLLEVFQDRAGVVLGHDPERVAYLLPSEVRPPGMVPADVEQPFEAVH